MSNEVEAPSSRDEDAGGVGVEVDRPRVNPLVFAASAIAVLAIALWALVDNDGAGAVIGGLVGAISGSFGWYYFVVATVVLVFVVGVAVSRLGNVRLGPDHARPEYSLFTWTAMLFAAGIGIDLVFFAVSEPVTQYLEPPTGPGETVEAARQAVVWTLFHYGVTGWAMYALMGMALGYFAYRYELPLSIRSALYPLVGKRVHGRFGDAVDVAAVLGTIFGIATSLGIGVVQLNFGLTVLFGIEQGRSAQIGLIALSVVMATISAVAGVDKGIRRLSELNVLLAAGLMLFVLVSGRTGFLLDGLVLNIGDYVSRFPSLTLNTFAFEQPTEWLNAWTLFFWAWWIAWAPFVGLFLARISRGRTIRQFVAGVLVIPFGFIVLWISIFGNSALDLLRTGDATFGQAAVETPESAFYALLAEHPGAFFTAGLATLIGLLFYVTSADSGALVMGNFTSRLPSSAHDAPVWLRVFWAAATGLLTLAMLLVGGVPTLQNATIIMGLPFSVVMLMVMVGLYRALRVESFREASHRAVLRSSLSERTSPDRAGRSWRQRVARAVSHPDRAATERFLRDVGRPALEEVAEELRTQGMDVELTEGPEAAGGLAHHDLVVAMGTEQPFAYRMWPTTAAMPSYAKRAQSAQDVYYRVEVYLTEGSQSYDVMGYTREQVIGDVLDQYERHLEFLRLGRTSGTPNATSVLPDDPTPTGGPTA
ncbi:choline BCCT transporter BetT [Pseudokineococcus sp. 1T1Z-3]|uniref:choline BCCT transporter BetT n=1 Tax=Pseudokineococcus sp. 1T1Z-3 TaxID=3132745 RepID=UPI0030959B95